MSSIPTSVSEQQVQAWADGIAAGTLGPEDIPVRCRDRVQVELLMRWARKKGLVGPDGELNLPNR